MEPKVRPLRPIHMWGMDKHGLIWRDDALAAGISDVQIAKAIRDEAITVVGRGGYVPTSVLPADPGDAYRERYRQRSLAAAVALERSGHDDRAVSHQSAAALLGLGLLLPDRTAVHITNGRSAGGNTYPKKVVHTGGLPEADLTVVDGLRVTNLARTAVDIALSLTDCAQILAVFDSGLRMGVSRAELTDRLAAPRRGVARARHVLAFANGLSANPGESWGRAQMIEAGLPIPILQSEYDLGDGHTALCDYDWDGQVVGEFDGFGKYLREELRPGEDPGEVVVREKLREDRLRDRGLGVVRWGWRQLRRRTLVPYLRERLPKLGIPC